MTDEGPSVAQSLLAELEAGGELVDAGGFSIDSAQARRKLQDFQLADPHSYVLLLVEAAVLAGADPVRISTGSELTVEVGHARFERGELEQLFAAVFIELTDVDEAERTRRRVLQKLAFACNTALRLEPREIVVELADERELLRLHIVGDRLELEVAAPDPAVAPGTRVRVRHSVGAGSPEVALVHKHCRFSAASIVLDGQPVSVGHVFALDTGGNSLVSNARKVRPVLIGERRVGLSGFRFAHDGPPEAWILTNGVLVERLTLPKSLELPPGFGAVVELDLPKDLSQTQLVRGPEYDAAMAAIRASHEHRARFQARRRSPSKLERAGPLASVSVLTERSPAQVFTVMASVVAVGATALFAPASLGIVTPIAIVVGIGAWWGVQKLRGSND